MDTDKFDEIVLAMLWYNQRTVGSAWKGFDREATERLFQTGLISDPKSARKSVVISEAGDTCGEEAFARKFGELGKAP